MSMIDNIARASQPDPHGAFPLADVSLTRISVFDLDRTLTQRGTWSPFLLFAACHLAPWRLIFVPVVPMCMIAYKAGLISRDRLKELMQRLMMGARVAGDHIHPIAAAFAQRQIERNCYFEGIVAIETERAEGRLIVLATAAQRFYAEPLAAKLACDLVVATESKWDGDSLLAQIEGRNCRSTEKRDAIERALLTLGLARDQVSVRFYSDDTSDVPTFEWADEAIVVNAGAKMRKIARRRGWRSLRWTY
jgi:HAD superfamily phosphoserine phosphatase-like hydrolase